MKSFVILIDYTSDFQNKSYIVNKSLFIRSQQEVKGSR